VVAVAASGATIFQDQKNNGPLLFLLPQNTATVDKQWSEA